MKRTISIAVLLLIATFAVIAGGSSDNLDADGWRRYTRLDSFHSVDVRTDAEVTLIPGTDWEVKARGHRDDLDDLDVYVSGRTLVIRRESLFRFMRSGDRLEVEVTLPRLARLELSSSGSIRSREAFESNDVELRLTGSGEMDIEAFADTLDCASSGSGDFRFRGRVNTVEFKSSGSGDADMDLTANLMRVVLTGSGTAEIRGETEILELKLSGSGDVRADRMEAKDAEVSISGSGDADIRATRSLEAAISGSGSVYYSGEPAATDFRGTGSGRIRRK